MQRQLRHHAIAAWHRHLRLPQPTPAFQRHCYRPSAHISFPAALTPMRWAHVAPSSPSLADTTTTTTTLMTLQHLVHEKDYDGCATYYEKNFDPSRQHFIDHFCRGFAAEARDALLLLMRVYTNLGRIDKVREVLSVGLRDLAAVEACSLSPLSYVSVEGWSLKGDASGSSPNTGRTSNAGTSWGSLHSEGAGAVLSIQEDLLPSTTASSSHDRVEIKERADTEPPITWSRPSLLNASLFNAYLEALTRRNKFAAQEVVFLLDQMKACGIARDALTYHFLVELHVRAGFDPTGLWEEMAAQEPPVAPLPVTIQTFLLRVVPHSSDPPFVVEVTRAALRHGTAILDKRMLAELVEQWLKGPDHTLNVSAASSSHHNSTSTSTSTSTNSSVPAAKLGLGSGGGSSVQYPPEYVLWLLLELELRCVLEKASFAQYVPRHFLTELLLRCAKCTDAGTAEQVLALMDRHALPKTADVLALVVWCWSQALEVEKALDLIEWMALKGYLDQVDCFRKARIDSLRYTMDRHYLMTFAEVLSTPALAERALSRLNTRRQRGELVTAHTLDLVVLAFARNGEERRALQLVSTYEPRWGVAARTNTYNSLLIGCARHHSTLLHRVVYRAMVKSGVTANVFTFRVLIRQAVVSGNIDEAIYYLEEVTKHPGLRVEVEMILPILERAARVGDVETANRISQYSLKCDIGIDGGVLRSVMQQLTQAGQNVDVLKGQLPLHEALRSRSKAGRQRARNEILV